MAATAGRDAKRSQGDLATAYVEAGEVIYSGTIVCADTDGFGVPGADTSGYLFLGIAADTVSNASGADGDKKVAVYTEGIFELAFSSASQAVVGDPVYVVDNNTVALVGTTTNDVLVGKVVEYISASAVRVKI